MSVGNKNTQHIHSVQCSVTGKAGVMDCLSSGNKLLTPFPDPFPVWRGVQLSGGEIESVCSLLLQHVFPNSAIPPFSCSQVLVPGGVTEHSTQLQAVQEICVLRPKTCFDRLCHIWRDIYSESHSFLQPHDTILLTGSICTPCKSKTYFAHGTKKKKRSYVAIVNRILMRETHLAVPKDQTRAIFSHPTEKQKVALWQL